MTILQSLIMDEIEARDPTNVLTTQRRANLCLDLNTFVIAAIDKYVKGQKEHGGDLKDRDLLMELYAELVDSVIYLSEEKRKRNGRP
jgi:hypothetical protein